MHALHPCYILELTDVSVHLYCAAVDLVLTRCQAEGRLEAEPISWVRDQLDRIFKATGHRAKNTILCKAPFSPSQIRADVYNFITSGVRALGKRC